MKIVSLLPSATEIVYALGLQDDLCGVTFECDFPRDTRNKRVVSTTSLPLEADSSPADIDRLVREKVADGEPLYRLDEQAIQEMQPDLILAQDLCRVCAVPSTDVSDALDKLGSTARVISLDPNTLEDILGGIVEVAEVTGVADRARRLVGGLRERVAAVTSIVQELAPVLTLSLEWADPPFVGGHWIPEMVRRAGGIDVLGKEGEPSRRVTWDEVAESAAEAVVYMPCGYFLDDAIEQGRALYEREEFARLPAARSGNVFAVDASAYFSRPGPRIVDGLEILAWTLHLEAFPEPPAGRVARISPS